MSSLSFSDIDGAVSLGNINAVHLHAEVHGITGELNAISALNVNVANQQDSIGFAEFVLDLG